MRSSGESAARSTSAFTATLITMPASTKAAISSATLTPGCARTRAAVIAVPARAPSSTIAELASRTLVKIGSASSRRGSGMWRGRGRRAMRAGAFSIISCSVAAGAGTAPAEPIRGPPAKGVAPLSIADRARRDGRPWRGAGGEAPRAFANPLNRGEPRYSAAPRSRNLRACPARSAGPQRRVTSRPARERRMIQQAAAPRKVGLLSLLQQTDIVLALVVMLIIVMMVVPLPPALLDMLIALNISIGVTILLVSIYASEPLDFSVFPTLLLVCTLFRLALNVSSTRLILLHAHAGNIIQSFGQFVIGGSLIVGVVISLILMVIQFVVITNGSGRVAEVAARFTLDAMPGKQMAIDADLNAGLIDESEARRRRKH